MAFCTTLRKRPSFASIIPALTAGGYLKENNLNSHDIDIPLISHSSATAHATSRQLRILLLSPRAVSEAVRQQTADRLRRFAALTGGIDLLVVFLLTTPKNTNSAQQADHEESTSGIIAYSQLQLMLHDGPELSVLPVLPVASLEQLPALLKRHTSAVMGHSSRPKPRPKIITWDLLRQCTMNPPMDETTAHCITDVFTNLRELALACSTEADVVMNPSAAPSSDRTIGRDDVSPYFSSSSGEVARYDGGRGRKSELAKKLDKLRALNEEAARDVVQFWQCGWLID